jgi:hypothetical protein
VKDSADQKLAYVYYEDEPGRRSAAKLLTKDEARRIGGQYRDAPRETSMRTAMDDCFRPPESGRRFQISVLRDAAETTVSQTPVYWASALLRLCLDFVVALPFGAHHHHRAHRHYRPHRENLC